MKFSQPAADVFVPDGTAPARALARTTHLCVVAHQDDLEIMAQPAIDECFGSTSKFFTGVVVTNGAGSPRRGPYAGVSDERMQEIRREEQREAARIGRYNLVVQLAHPSSGIKAAGRPGPIGDLAAIFAGIDPPSTAYFHNPADKHDTHVAVLLRCLEAIRRVPPGRRPARAIGCEGWRGLDWVLDSEKLALDAGRRPELAERLIRVFDSQVAGGKRYDVAALGRRAANATFRDSHRTDELASAVLAIDLTPLLADDAPSVRDFTAGFIERLRSDVLGRLEKLGG